METIFAFLISAAMAQGAPPRPMELPSHKWAAAVNAALINACPTVVGVSFAVPANKSTWRIDYAEGTTEACKAAARQAVANFVIPGN